jgi:hypothetical protein
MATGSCMSIGRFRSELSLCTSPSSERWDECSVGRYVNRSIFDITHCLDNELNICLVLTELSYTSVYIPSLALNLVVIMESGSE